MTTKTATFDQQSLASQRLLSLDALRGFDMFWIVGGRPIFQEAAKLWDWPWLVWFAGQLEHPVWHGFTVWDSIFPLFLFISGVAMPYSFARRLERGATKADLYRHAIVRGLALVALGMITNGEMGPFNWPNSRLPSVLGCIGLAYMAAAFIVLNTNLRGQFLWIAGILAGWSRDYLEWWPFADLRAIPTMMDLARAASNGQALTTIARSASSAALSAAPFDESAVLLGILVLGAGPVSPARQSVNASRAINSSG